MAPAVKVMRQPVCAPLATDDPSDRTMTPVTAFFRVVSRWRHSKLDGLIREFRDDDTSDTTYPIPSTFFLHNH